MAISMRSVNLFLKRIRPFIRLLSRYKYIILLIYFLAVIIYILSPIFHGGNVCNTDFVSNLVRARFMYDNLTRHMSLDRWTYMQYLGFQPFMFYFPGFFILINLITILSFGLIPLMVAYKLLILASFLFLPISVYFCMRTFNFKKIHSFFAAIFSLASGMVYGYGLKNLTCWGMDVAFFVISLLPCVLALYHKFIAGDTLNVNALFYLSFLFAVIAISHLQTTLHFILVLLVYNIYIFYKIKGKLLYIKKNLLILFLTCLLAGFWYFPVLKYHGFFGVLTLCEVDTLANRTINFLGGNFLTIQPVAILFVIGLLLLKSKSRKRRLLAFFPLTALTIFIIAAEYYAKNLQNEFIRSLFTLFTTRSYAVFCLLLSFIAGFALGEIIILIRKTVFLLVSRLGKGQEKRGIRQILNHSISWLSRIIILILCIFFIAVSLEYMFSFKSDIFTEADNAQNPKPKLLMEAFDWLKNNASRYDLIGQQYQMEPIPGMSGAGYLVSLQYYTDLPIFGGGHFESSQAAMMMTNYDSEEYFKFHDADFLHQNLLKFNMQYLMVDNRQVYLDKLLKYKEGFEQVFANAMFTILKIKGTNSMFLPNPGQNKIEVIGFEPGLERPNPRLTWKIDNHIPGNVMTLSLAYFPKWKVYIDGGETDALKNHDLLLMIPLEKKGEQTVTIEYKQIFFEIVFNILSLITLLSMAGMFVRYIVIKRNELLIFKGSYWKSGFTQTALIRKAFLLTAAITGILVIFLCLGAIFRTGPVNYDGTDDSVFNNTGWQFSFKTGGVKLTIAHSIILLPNRKIEGYYSKNEDHWGMENGVVVFYNEENLPTTRFTRVTTDSGRLILEGDFLLKDQVIHILEQIKDLP